MSEFTNTRETPGGLPLAASDDGVGVALLGVVCGATRRAPRTATIRWSGSNWAANIRNRKMARPHLRRHSCPHRRSTRISHLGLEKGPPAEWDKGAKISFQPDGSDWLLSLGVRYGKSSRSDVREGHPSTASQTKYSGSIIPPIRSSPAQSSESQFILDFRAGKDVGLGMFGNGGSSVTQPWRALCAIQFAQQCRRSNPSRPIRSPIVPYHKFYASFAAKRKFTGVGPSLSWDASASLIGNPAAGSITLDWGAEWRGSVWTPTGARASPANRNRLTIISLQAELVYQHSTSPRLEASRSSFPISAALRACRGAIPMRRSASAIAPTCSSAPWMAASMRRTGKMSASTGRSRASASA